MTCAAFLARLKKEGLEGLDIAADQSSEGVLHGEKRLGATLQPTLERLGEAEKLALEFAALLPPDQVALPWLRALVAQTFPEMERDAEPGYPDPWKNVLRRLFSLRLFQATDVRDADGQPRVVRVHRLVQELVRLRIAHSFRLRQQPLVEFVLGRSRLLWDTWVTPSNRWEIDPVCACAWLWMAEALPLSESISYNISRAIEQLGHLVEAKQLNERALELREKQLVTDDKGMVQTLTNLGNIKMHLGNLQEAKRLMTKALDIYQTRPPNDQTDVSNIYSLMSEIELNLGNTVSARDLTLKCLEIEERLLPPNDPTLAVRYSNLGGYYSILGDLSKAKHFCERAVCIGEANLPQELPQMALSYNALAIIEQRLGNLIEAERFMRRSMEIRKNVYGEKHTMTANGMSGLSSILLQMGRTQEAEELTMNAISIWSHSESPDDWRMGKALHTLGKIQSRRGDRAGAGNSLRQARRLLRPIYGENHPLIEEISMEIARIS